MNTLGQSIFSPLPCLRQQLSCTLTTDEVVEPEEVMEETTEENLEEAIETLLADSEQ